MTFESVFLYFAVVVIYFAIAVIVDHITPVKMKELPDWLAITFWWSVLPSQAICKIIKRGEKK